MAENSTLIEHNWWNKSENIINYDKFCSILKIFKNEMNHEGSLFFAIS